MMQFSLKSDIQEVDNYFKKLGYYFPNLVVQTLRTVTNEMKKGLKKNNTFKRRTGDFIKSIYSKVVAKKNWARVSIRYKSGRKDAQNIIKANVAEAGANIYPKKGDYLTFKVNDSWVRKKSITIQPKPFFERTYKSILDKIDEIMLKVANDLMNKGKL